VKPTTAHLFVYGTLRSGYPNQHVLDAIGGTRQAATVYGDLVESGWGAAMGCPGLVLNADGKAIPGEVFSSTNLDKHWDELDRFEGEEYQRVEAEAFDVHGNGLRVWIYTIKPC
jgi:gamma-glutamylcyclotransferase (GGCT)/AIG2-like uncharacterized protein YtfP